MNKHFELIVKSPLIISSGEKISPFEYYIDKNKKEIYLLKFDEILNRRVGSSTIKKALRDTAAKKGDLKYFLQFIDKRWGEHLDLFCDKLELSDSELNSQVELDLPIMNLKEPYIPGSSIKGAIKTALYYYYLKTDENARTKFINLLRNYLNRDNKRKEDNKFKGTIDIDPLFSRDTETDRILSKFTVRDFHFKTFSLTVKRILRANMRSEKNSELTAAIFISSGSIAEGDIMISEDLNKKLGGVDIKEIISSSYGDFRREIEEKFKKYEITAPNATMQLGKYGDYFTKSIGTFLVKHAPNFYDNKNLIKLRKRMHFGRRKVQREYKYGEVFPKTITYVEESPNKKVQPGWVTLEEK